MQMNAHNQSHKELVPKGLLRKMCAILFLLSENTAATRVAAVERGPLGNTEVVDFHLIRLTWPIT